MTLSNGLTQLAPGAVSSLAAGVSRPATAPRPRTKAWRRLSAAPFRCRPGCAAPPCGSSTTEEAAGAASGRPARSSPGLFDSGYFVLSALDGAPPKNAPPGLASGRPGKGGPGRDAARLHPLHLQHRRLDRFEQAAGRRRVRPGARNGPFDRRRGGAAQLNDYSRVTRADPDPGRRDHGRHLPHPGAHPACNPAGGDRGRAQPGHGGCRLRRPHPPLQPARRLAAGRSHLCRRGWVDDDVRHHLRPRSTTRSSYWCGCGNTTRQMATTLQRSSSGSKRPPG